MTFLEAAENRSRGADVICAAPDDLHYELEPMLEMENQMEEGAE